MNWMNGLYFVSWTIVGVVTLLAVTWLISEAASLVDSRLFEGASAVFLLILFVFLLGATSGCGGTYKVEGHVDVDHNVNIAQLETYFQAVCERGGGESCAAIDVNKCTNCLVGRFLEAVR